MVSSMSEHLEDNREFIATPEQWQAFVELIGRPAAVKLELAQLFLDTQRLDFNAENSEDAE
jgi:uncharacterized protein (DUF1778 family)